MIAHAACQSTKYSCLLLAQIYHFQCNYCYKYSTIYLSQLITFVYTQREPLKGNYLPPFHESILKGITFVPLQFPNMLIYKYH